MTNEASVLRRHRRRQQGADADVALQELGSDLVGEAYVTATVTVWDEDPGVADERLRLVEKIDPGPRLHLHARDASTRSRPGSASLPGHVYANVRQPPVSTLNLAHMMPLSAVWAGPERDEHFEAPPLFFARTEGSTPFRFSLHVGDVGHTLIVGPTGAGKCVLLALMALAVPALRRARRSLPSISAAASARPRSRWAATGTISAARLVRRRRRARRACSRSPAIDDAGERAWAAEWIATSSPAKASPSRPS